MLWGLHLLLCWALVTRLLVALLTLLLHACWLWGSGSWLSPEHLLSPQLLKLRYLQHMQSIRGTECELAVRGDRLQLLVEVVQDEPENDSDRTTPCVAAGGWVTCGTCPDSYLNCVLPLWHRMDCPCVPCSHTGKEQMSLPAAFSVPEVGCNCLTAAGDVRALTSIPCAATIPLMAVFSFSATYKTHIMTLRSSSNDQQLLQLLQFKCIIL